GESSGGMRWPAGTVVGVSWIEEYGEIGALPWPDRPIVDSGPRSGSRPGPVRVPGLVQAPAPPLPPAVMRDLVDGDANLPAAGFHERAILEQLDEHHAGDESADMRPECHTATALVHGGGIAR